MKCQNAKCKSRARVQTMRTKDNGEQTERSKKCPKCGVRFETIELPKVSYLHTIAELQGKIAEQERLKLEGEYKLQDVRAILDTFRDLLLPRQEAPRGSARTRKRS